jgi:hypothetical protein
MEEFLSRDEMLEKRLLKEKSTPTNFSFCAGSFISECQLEAWMQDNKYPVKGTTKALTRERHTCICESFGNYDSSETTLREWPFPCHQDQLFCKDHVADLMVKEQSYRLDPTPPQLRFQGHRINKSVTIYPAAIPLNLAFLPSVTKF